MKKLIVLLSIISLIIIYHDTLNFTAYASTKPKSLLVFSKKSRKSYTIFSNKTYMIRVKTKIRKKELSYTSSNKKILKVYKNGTIKPLKNGHVVLSIYQKRKNSKRKKLFHKKIFVKTLVQKISFSGNNHVQVNSTYHLIPSIYPKNSSNKIIRWTSSNPQIASISQNGTLKVFNIGYFKITARTTDGSNLYTQKPYYSNSNNGFLTYSQLKSLDLKHYDRLMIVAHPDDETLWGGAHLAQHNYLVIVLTNANTNNGRRKKELLKALSYSNDKAIIMNYPDTINGIRSDWKNCKTGIIKDIRRLFQYKNWKEIVTHNPNGEYGHIHHKLTNVLVTQVAREQHYQNLMYFGKFYSEDALEYSTIPQISPQLLKTKERMLINAYPSQSVVTSHYRYFWAYENWTRAFN